MDNRSILKGQPVNGRGNWSCFGTTGQRSGQLVMFWDNWSTCGGNWSGLSQLADQLPVLSPNVLSDYREKSSPSISRLSTGCLEVRIGEISGTIRPWNKNRRTVVAEEGQLVKSLFRLFS